MSPDAVPDVRRLFEEALEIQPEQRADWLSAYAGDLRPEVEKLLRAHQSGTDFLNRVGATLSATAIAPLTGRRVGPYQLGDPLGHGGMGTVYRASRADDAFHKHVAIKLLGFQYAGPVMELAFRMERQILASLEHPNIARLIDGGVTPEGILYIVIELVEGTALDRFCEENNLPVDRRLEIFESVCSAVDYAHRSLVVHRDLKPSNILVTPEGQVKLLDFGIAKVLGGAASISPAGTLPTLPGMTPLYASPEQIQQRPITTAADIYSLGVILYTLLTGGVHPFRAYSSNLSDMLRAICEHDPPLPSAVAKSAFQRQLRGDLDNIVLKTMAKAPADRYSSVAQIADDVRRYIRGEPVAARGNGMSYRISKFVRRNRAPVALAAILLLILGGGVASTLHQYGVANRERLLAERRAREAEQARSETERQRALANHERERAEARRREADRMRQLAESRHGDVRALATSILFGIYDNIRNLAGSAQARKLALEKSLQYLEALAKESEGNPALESELAAGYERAGELMGSLFDTNTEGGRAAVPILGKALTLRRQVVAAQPGNSTAVLALAMSYFAYGSAQYSAGQTDDAIATIERGLAVARAGASDGKYPRIKAILQARLCGLYNVRSDVSAMLSLCRNTVRDLRHLTEQHPSDRDIMFNLAATEGQLGNALRIHGHPEEAVSLLRLASSRMRSLLVSDPNDIRPRRALAAVQTYLTVALGALRESAKPEDWSEAIDAIESTLALDPADYRTMMYLGYALQKYSAVLLESRRDAEAEAAFERAIGIYREVAAKPKAGAVEFNDYSAALSKCPFPRLQNPSLALDLALKANETSGGRNPIMLDTLAWAYFRIGQAAKAIETARHALSLLPVKDAAVETGMRKEIAEGLAEFQKAR
jgi:eukaryotic-like serine/threonine-protein kinase